MGLVDDVLFGPDPAELCAGGGQFFDKVDEFLVVGAAAAAGR
nr:hypothetical protein [Streptomyces sp. DSM 41886]